MSDIAEELTNNPLTEDCEEYLEIVNKNPKLFHKKATGINSNLLKSDEEVIVKLLSAINKPDAEKYLVPSSDVVNNICAKLDTADAAYESNQKRCQLLQTYHDIINLSQFFEKWKALTTVAVSSSVPLNYCFELWFDDGISFS